MEVLAYVRAKRVIAVVCGEIGPDQCMLDRPEEDASDRVVER